MVKHRFLVLEHSLAARQGREHMHRPSLAFGTHIAWTTGDTLDDLEDDYDQ
jgi:hypothetical protein